MRINEWGAESYTFLLSDVILHPSPPFSSMLHCYIGTTTSALHRYNKEAHTAPFLAATLLQQAVCYNSQLFCNIINHLHPLHWYNIKTSSALRQATLLQFNQPPTSTCYNNSKCTTVKMKCIGLIKLE